MEEPGKDSLDLSNRLSVDDLTCDVGSSEPSEVRVFSEWKDSIAFDSEGRMVLRNIASIPDVKLSLRRSSSPVLSSEGSLLSQERVEYTVKLTEEEVKSPWLIMYCLATLIVLILLFMFGVLCE